MKLLRVLAVLVCLTAGCAVQQAPAPVPAERQVLVVLEDRGDHLPLPAGSKRGYRGDTAWPVSLHTQAKAGRLARDHGLREIHAWPIPGIGVFCVVFQVPPGQERGDLIARLDSDPRTARVQPVNVYHGMLAGTYDDPLFEAQYGTHSQLLESVHALTTGEGVRIGIVDGHVDTAHVDLHGQIAAQFPPEDSAGLDGLRHGTAVAGVIAAAAGNGEGVVGLAPDATVSVYAGCRDVHAGATRCTTVSLAEAIERAVDDASDVINLSIAGPDDWLLERLLHHAHARGAVLVAADNSNEGGRDFPGSLPFVHTAGTEARAWFARHEQFSTRAGGGYQVFFGSSMAAAGVAGAAALLRAHRSPAETEAMLEDLLATGCPGDAGEDSPLWMVADDEDCRL